MQITVDVDARNWIRYNQRVQKQMPFALSLALNTVTKDAQQAVQKSLHRNFVIRRKTFIERTIKILQFSKKKAKIFYTEIGVDPERDFLAKFEQGGLKLPRGKALGVPLEAKRTQGGIVRKDERLSSLQLHKNRHGQTVGSNRTFVAGDKVFKRTGRRGRSTVRALYVWKPSVPIDARLHFFRTVRQAVSDFWEQRMTEALQRALRTAR